MQGSCECENINWITTEKLFNMSNITICEDCKCAVIWNY
jgi:hypothetical protein